MMAGCLQPCSSWLFFAEGRKKGKEYTDAFMKVLHKALHDLMKRADDKTRRSAERLLKIWEERRIFSPSYSKTLRECVGAKSSSGAAGNGAAAQPAGGSIAAGDGEDKKRLAVRLGTGRSSLSMYHDKGWMTWSLPEY
jgi:hypothetical protein